MAKIAATLSTLVNDIGKSEVLLRFVGGRGCVHRAKSGIFVAASRWSDRDGRVIVPRLETAEQLDLLRTQKRLDDLCGKIIEAFISADKSIVDKKWLELVIDKHHNPDKYKSANISFFDAFDDFLSTRKLTIQRYRHYLVVRRALRRFELYRGSDLTLANMTADVVFDFDVFLRGEHEFCADEKYKYIYDAVPETRTPQQRGSNTIIGIHKKVRTLFLWCIDMGHATRNPYRHFAIEESVYGTPYYITIDERDRLFHTNLQRHPQLAKQRDIFVFQCLIGCRVGDLLKMTKSNVMGGAVEYVPRKTKEGRPVTVRVPLSTTAKIIVKRYADIKGDALLPFISEQKYNDAIKRIFRAAGLTRWVTVINPTTREEEKRRLCDIASSHLARRTFIGNLYKQVKDPNLVGALSGHKEGSKAFARYRSIDEDMRTELVNLLESKNGAK